MIKYVRKDVTTVGEYTDELYLQNRQRRRRRRRMLYRLRQRVIELTVLAVLVSAVAIPISLVRRNRDETPVTDPAVSDVDTAPTEKPRVVYPTATADTVELGATVDAEYAVLVDVTEGRIVAQKRANTRVYPASVTKVMSLLVAVENATDMDATYEMSYTFLDTLYWAGATVAGYSSGEKAVVKDMLYGCILPSGADATIGLANLLAGSETTFADWMNAKAAELVLKDTHFTNSSGLHDDNHYTTALDMAVTLAAAMQDPTCREVLSTYQYTTTSTPQHPEGLLLTSTLFSRMYGDEPEGATVIAGKTGYTTQAGHTMASYAKGDDGHDYIFVTMDGSSKWEATYDVIDTLTAFCGPDTTETVQ